MISYYFNPKKNDIKENKSDVEKTKKTKKDSLVLNIYNGDKLIRTLKKVPPTKKGIFRWYWNMDEKGKSRPSRNLRSSKREPSGVKVIPGEYKLVLSYKNEKSEEKISVKSDPRLVIDIDNLKSVYKESKVLENYMSKAYDAVKQLIESKKVLNEYLKLLKNNKSDDIKSLNKEIKEDIKKIDTIVALFLGKEDKRQGIVRNPESTVMTRLRTASTYIGSRKSGLTSTEKNLIEHAKNELKEALSKTNNYFSNNWPSIKEKISSKNVSQFKEINMIKTDDL
jgi:hypothetical protein